jgi:thiamine-phosphate pyrophosphorylase
MSSRQHVAFRFYLITDDRLAEADMTATCDAVLRAARPGDVAVQLRNKQLDAGRLLTLGLRLREICNRRGAALFVNDRIDVALACGADGVHLPANGVSPRDARRLVGSSKLIGVSTHTSGDVRRAALAGADFVVYGPVFAPISKASGFAPGQGVESLATVCHNAAIPVFALGGITPERIVQLRGSGAAGVAAIGAVFRSPDPAAAVSAILDATTRELTGPGSANEL